MNQQPEITEDQARELITRLMGSGAQMVLHPFEHGWLAQEILSEQERDRGMHLGQGSYVIDRTGVVTVHSSLPMPVVIAQYTEGRREGRIPGRQVWPEPTTTAQ